VLPDQPFALDLLDWQFLLPNAGLFPMQSRKSSNFPFLLGLGNFLVALGRLHSKTNYCIQINYKNNSKDFIKITLLEIMLILTILAGLVRIEYMQH
jgi:hypothetical protein